MQTNTILHADNLTALREIPDSTVDLVYCDPPFNTGRDFGEYSDNPDVEKAENLAFEHQQFQWLQGILSPKQTLYFQSVIPRIIEIHRILKPTGALYWHCDYKTNAYIRLILNQVFGQPQFRNEIVWSYKSTAVYDAIKHCWKNNLDNILFYAKPKHEFQPQYRPLTYKQEREQYPYTDSKGRKYRHRRDTGAPSLYDSREYADENRGSRIETTWTDILIAQAKERTGYPTQKPLALLKRIIQASSKEGQIVLDPYCGSGTTLIAAKQLGRKYIGIDENAEAIFIAKKRLDMVK